MWVLDRFYWVEERRLAGCSRPGGTGSGVPSWHGHDGDGQDPAELGRVERDLSWLGDQGIGAVLSLTELPLDEAAVARQRFSYAHIPVPDMTAPLPEQFHRALEFIDLNLAAGRAVAVHCLQGQGRTGSILAAHLIREGMSAELAIAELRELCPGAIESPEQKLALHAFATRKDWII